MSRILFNSSGRLDTPTVVLSTVGGKLLGEVPFIHQNSIEIVVNMDDASEISFDVDKYRDGVLNPLWDSIVDFKLIWYKEIDLMYVIQVDVNDEDGIVKHVTGVSAGQVELGQIMLRNLELNTESDIIEEDYQISTIYNSTNKKGSILDRMLEKAPHYSVDYVDESIAVLQRMYSFNNKSIKDSFDEISEDIGCLFVYNVGIVNNRLHRGIKVYDMMCVCQNPNCGERFESGDVCPECGSTNIKQPYGDDTGIVVDKESLASSVKFETDVDSVKNCFSLEAGDDMMTATVRMCMPSNDGYLWYINEETMADMSADLRERIISYNAESAIYNKTKVYDISYPYFGQLVTTFYDETHNPVVYNSSGTGFASVIDAYYNAVTMRYYLRTSMMPTFEYGDYNAVSQLRDIKSNLTYVALAGLGSSTSSSTVESAIKSAAKMWYYQSAYDISVSTTSWSNPTWTGVITLTSESDELDTSSTQMTIPVTDNYEKYVQQQLEKRLSLADKQDTGIVALFKKSAVEFNSELIKYSYDCLQSYIDICQTLLDLLIEQGCGSVDSDLYSSTYTNYYNKLHYLIEEIRLRNYQISAVDAYIMKLEKIIDGVHAHLDLADWLGEELYLEFAAYRREDTYNNSNYISDGLTDSELIENARLFIKSAEREIYKSANLQHKITADVYNLMLMPEFDGLLDKFDVGNWIRVIVDGVAYKLRLLSFTVNFGSLENIVVQFSDVVKTMTGYYDLKSIIAQAASMATSYGAVVRQAEKAKSASDTFSLMFSNGLDLTNTKLLSDADNQELTIDEHGLTMKRYDPILDDYVGEQIKMTNTTIAFSNDKWRSVKTAFGKYYDGTGTEKYGLIAETLIGKVIAGGELTIQSAKTNGDGESVFKVDGDGVSINNADLKVECDNGSQVVIDPTYGLLIGKGNVLNSDGTKNEDNITTWIGANGSLQLRTSSGSTYESDLSNSIKSITVQYYKSTSKTNTIGGEWSSDKQGFEDGYYIWQRHKNETFGGNITYSNPVCLTTDVSDGNDGNGIASITEYYLSSASDTGITVSGNTWSASPTEINSNTPYLWKYECIEYTKTDPMNTNPVIVSTYVTNGENGRGISSVEERYLATSAGTGVTINTSGWTSAVQNTSEDKKYLWNYEIINYTDGSTPSTSTPAIIGMFSKDGKNGDNGTSSYAYIKYSANSNGSGFVDTPSSDTKYIGVYTGTSSSAPTSASSYKWSKYVGEDGNDGNDGNGISSITYYYKVTTTQSKPDASSITSTSIPTMSDTNKYLWQKEVIDFTDSSVSDKVTVSLIAVHGSNGSNGTSVSIESTSVTYAVSDNGSSTPNESSFATSIPNVNKGQYLWTKTVVNYSGNKSTTSYSVSYKGTDGDKGDKGNDGVSYYTHIVYSANSDGSGFVSDPSSETKYIGICTNDSQEAPSSSSSYVWSKFVGDDGEDGEDGNGIKSITYYYAATQTQDAPNANAITSVSIPEINETNKYLWQKEVIDFSDDNVADKVTVCLIAVHGTSVSISSTSVKYASSSSGTSTPNDSEFGTAIPNVANGNYLWTKTTVVYSDNKKTESYSVAYKGTNGSSSYTHIRYSENSDGSGFSAAPSDSTKYIGICVSNSQTAPSTNTSYSWSKYVGDDGNDGNGINTIVYAYKATSSQTAPSASDSDWATTMPKLSEDKKYLWQKETIDFTDSSVSDKTTVLLIAAYGDSGTSITIDNTAVTYAASSSGLSAPAVSEFSTSIPNVDNGQYLWTRTLVEYSDGSSTDAYSVSYKGTNGVSITGVVEYYRASSLSSGVTKSNGNGETWTTGIQTATSAKKYLWNYETISYSNGTSTDTTPVIIGTYSADGVSITGITNYYMACNLDSGVSAGTNIDQNTTWTESVQTATSDKPYLWNYEKITYSSGSPTITSAAIIGTYSDVGRVVVDSVAYYYISDSYATTPDLPSVTNGEISSGWSIGIPVVNNDMYLWCSMKMVYEDNSFVFCTPYCVSDITAKDTIKELVKFNGELTNDENGILARYTKSIEDNTSSISSILEELALKMDSSGVEAKITSAIDGMNSYEVENYKLDSSGLHISQNEDTTVGMSTLIDHSGMVVSNNNTDVLKATNTGVEAINLHAKRFLIMGTHSRIEDMSGGYTACYWLG